MNNYIEALCEGRPLDLPNYNEDTEQWEIHFEESRWLSSVFSRDIFLIVVTQLTRPASYTIITYKIQ